MHQPKLSRRGLLLGAACVGCGSSTSKPHATVPANPAPRIRAAAPVATTKAWNGTPGVYQRLLERAVEKSVELTIDESLQTATETALATTKQSGAALLVEVASGRLLSMHEVAGRSEHPLTSAYAPGSTFKPVVAVAALEHNVATKVRCDGFLVEGRRRYRCTAEHGELDLEAALAHSCNVFFWRAGVAVGRDRLVARAQKMGFGSPAIRSLPTQLGALLGDDTPSQASRHLLNASIGQGTVKTTPLQLARAYLCLVNGGSLVDLTLMGGSAGERRTADIQKDDASRVRAGMRLAVTNGTAEGINDPNISFAGKTGTAQLPYRVDAPQRDDAWFVGYAPADAPSHLAVVLLENSGSGGQHAAPVAVAMLRAAL